MKVLGVGCSRIYSECGVLLCNPDAIALVAKGEG